jgi:hypothetical protein
MCFTTFIFCPLSFTFYQIWYLWYMKRRKWYLRPISRPKLTSSHVILQVSACMCDTCHRGTPQRWRGYHFYYYYYFLIILMISFIYIYIYIYLGWPSHPHFGQEGCLATPKGQNGGGRGQNLIFFFFPLWPLGVAEPPSWAKSHPLGQNGGGRPPPCGPKR